MVLNRFLISVPTALLVIGLTSPSWADFKAGAQAYGRGDYNAALNEFRPLAEQGQAQAQDYLGQMYANGQGVPQDHVEAIRWLSRAAKQSLPSAQYHLGVLYQKGRGVPQNYAQAAHWYRLAADQGHVAARANLGLLYLDGLGVPQSYAEAKHWLHLAAGQGNAVAQLQLGSLYMDGRGVREDYVHAHMWFTLAALQGLKEASKLRDALAQRMTRRQIAEAQQLAREIVPRQWTWTVDMNGDTIVTISDVQAWVEWAFYYPGDLAIHHFLLPDRRLAQFFELTPLSYQGRLSFVLSLGLWGLLAILLSRSRRAVKGIFSAWGRRRRSSGDRKRKEVAAFTGPAGS
jgi:hypothetical protein